MALHGLPLHGRRGFRGLWPEPPGDFHFRSPPVVDSHGLGTLIFQAPLWWTLVDWGIPFRSLPVVDSGGLGAPFRSSPVVFMTNWHQQKVDAGGVGSSLSKPSCGIYAQLASRQGGRWWTGESLCQASPWWAGEALFEAPPWWTLLDSVGLCWTPFSKPPLYKCCWTRIVPLGSI